MFKFLIPSYALFVFMASIWMAGYDSRWIFISLLDILFIIPYVWYCSYYNVYTGTLDLGDIESPRHRELDSRIDNTID